MSPENQDALNVIVRDGFGQNYNIEGVKRNMSVSDLKVMIGSVTDYPPACQRLIYNGRQLSDLRRLSFYCPNDNFMRIFLTMRVCGGVKVYMKNFNGYTLTMDFDVNDTIYDMKQRLETKTKVPIGQQRIIYAGTELENQYTWAYYNISQNAELSVTLRLFDDNIEVVLKSKKDI